MKRIKYKKENIEIDKRMMVRGKGIPETKIQNS